MLPTILVALLAALLGVGAGFLSARLGAPGWLAEILKIAVAFAAFALLPGVL